MDKVWLEVGYFNNVGPQKYGLNPKFRSELPLIPIIIAGLVTLSLISINLEA
jgi:hypothetical protein